MDTEPPSTTDDDLEPSQPPPTGRLRRLLPLAAGGLTAGLVALVVAAGWTPDFYRARLPAGGPLDGRDPAAAAAAAEPAARRLVTRAASLRAALEQVGPWEGVFSEGEINAFLALDVPRNHALVLPGWCREPRVELLPGRLRAAVLVGYGPLAAPLWIDADVTLQGPNQLRLAVTRARLGLVPLPARAVLGEFARRLGRLGAVAEIRRGGDRPVLVVYIPSTHEPGGLSQWLQAIRLAAGELAVAGETRRGPVRPAAGR